MTDFGTTTEEELTSALRWHGLLAPWLTYSHDMIDRDSANYCYPRTTPDNPCVARCDPQHTPELTYLAPNKKRTKD